MSTNQPGKPRVKFIDEAGTDTTDGHVIRIGGRIEEADTDGHALKGRGMQEAEVSRGRGIDEADTEGHVAKFRGVQPAGDDEDTEGHPFRK